MERQQNHICNASCPGTANGHTAQWGFRRLCKDKSLEDEECRGQHRKLITTNWEGHQCWPSYNHTGQRTQCGPFYGCSTFQANWKGEKAEWVSPEPTEMKKLSFGSTVLFYATTMNYFFTTLWCATKSGLYTTTGEDQLSGWIKKKLQSTSQSQTCTRKRSWSLFGCLLPSWSTTAFQIPVQPLHLRSMPSKSMRWAKNCNACSQFWSTGRAQFFSMTMPKDTSYNQRFKSWMNWATKFCFICHFSPDFSPTNYHFFKHLNNFLQGKHFNQEEAENAFQEFFEPLIMDFFML